MVLAVTATACGGSSGSGAAATTTAVAGEVQSGEVAVTAVDNTFNPQAVRVRAGSTVTFTNKGRNEHNVMPVGDTPFTIETAQFGPRATASFTLSTPGTYHYYCSLHGTPDKGMTGTIEVLAEGAS